MTGEPADSAIDVVVFAGPGIGHYLPVAGLLEQLAEPHRVGVCAQVRDDDPLAAKVRSDGFTFVPWPDEPGTGRSRSVLRLLRQTMQRRVVPWLARRGRPDTPLPPIPSRTAFALSSLLTPWSDASAARARSLDAVLTELRPRLVLTEGNEAWVERLAASHSLEWALYTTGPVSTVVRGRPVGPAGFPPAMGPGTRAANAVVRSAKQLRRAGSRRRVRRVAESLGHHDRRAPIATFAFSVAELDAYPGLPGHDFEYVGLFPYRAPAWWSPDMLDELDESERTSVVVTWGSGEHSGDASFFDRLLPALVELAEDRDVVVLSSQPEVHRCVTAAGCESLVAIDRQDGPPYDLFRRAAAVVTHGGYGTIKEAVALGAAVLVTPEVVADRMETAQRVLVSGVGRSVNRATVDTAALRAALHQVLHDSEVRAKVATVGAALRDDARHDDLIARLRAALSTPR